MITGKASTQKVVARRVTTPLHMIKGRAMPRLAPDALIEVSISNFGPISEGKFAIKPLTIFVGPNNSGKTYAATLAHSLLSSYEGRSTAWDLAALIHPHLSSKRFQQTMSVMEKLVLTSNNTNALPIPSKCSSMARDVLLGHSLKRRLIENIQNNFGTDPKNLIRFNTKSSRIEILYNASTRVTLHTNKDSTVKLQKTTKPYMLSTDDGDIHIYENNHDKKPGLDPLRSTIHRRATRTQEILGIDTNLGLQAFLILALTIEQNYLQHAPTSYYLPAARAGILSAYETIVSSVMQNAQYAGTRPFKIEQLSGVTSDFITHLINANTSLPPRIHNGGGMIEDMFGGSIVMSKPKAGLPKLTYRSSGMEIPISRSSSGITETAPLQILQNYAPRYDILALEEPEAHLHPENQTKLARHIIKFVKRGTRVIIITHGVFFLEQLSMFVRMSKISPSERTKLGYDEDDFIDDSDVAPYMFKPNARGGYSIHELNHSADEGIWQDEFINVTESMYAKDVKIDQFIDP